MAAVRRRCGDRISESAAPINEESCLVDLYEIPGPPRVTLLPLRDTISRGALSPPSVGYHLLHTQRPSTYPASGTRARRQPSMVCQFISPFRRRHIFAVV